MSSAKKKIRQQFRDAVFARDSHMCRVCKAPDHMVDEYDSFLDAHHITDRNSMPNGGYVKENGISLCPECHEKAEVFHSTGVAFEGFSPDDLYHLIGSSYEKAHDASEKLNTY